MRGLSGAKALKLRGIEGWTQGPVLPANLSGRPGIRFNGDLTPGKRSLRLKPLPGY